MKRKTNLLPVSFFFGAGGCFDWDTLSALPEAVLSSQKRKGMYGSKLTRGIRSNPRRWDCHDEQVVLVTLLKSMDPGGDL